MAGKTEGPLETAPSDYMQAWACKNIHDDGYGIPSPETLKEVTLALHAVQEFFIEPIAQALRKISDDYAKIEYTGLVPERDRPISFNDIGRLIAWADELRKDITYLLDPIVRITLLAHEDLQEIASGYLPGGVLDDQAWQTGLHRFYGLDKSLGEVL